MLAVVIDPLIEFGLQVAEVPFAFQQQVVLRPGRPRLQLLKFPDSDLFDPGQPRGKRRLGRTQFDIVARVDRFQPRREFGVGMSDRGLAFFLARLVHPLQFELLRFALALRHDVPSLTGGVSVDSELQETVVVGQRGVSRIQMQQEHKHQTDGRSGTGGDPDPVARRGIEIQSNQRRRHHHPDQARHESAAQQEHHQRQDTSKQSRQHAAHQPALDRFGLPQRINARLMQAGRVEWNGRRRGGSDFPQQSAPLQKIGRGPIPAVERLDRRVEFDAAGHHAGLHRLQARERTVRRVAIEQRGEQPARLVALLLRGVGFRLPAPTDPFQGVIELCLHCGRFGLPPLFDGRPVVGVRLLNGREFRLVRFGQQLVHLPVLLLLSGNLGRMAGLDVVFAPRAVGDKIREPRHQLPLVLDRQVCVHQARVYQVRVQEGCPLRSDGWDGRGIRGRHSRSPHSRQAATSTPFSRAMASRVVRTCWNSGSRCSSSRLRLTESFHEDLATDQTSSSRSAAVLICPAPSIKLPWAMMVPRWCLWFLCPQLPCNLRGRC